MKPCGGATATLETVWCMPEKTPFDIDERMSIIGDAGIIHIQDTFPNLGVVSSDKLHSPDTTYWPEFDGIRGGALREEFAYFASCALRGEAPAIGRPEDALAALGGGAPSCVSVFAGRVADTGRDPLPMMTAAVEMVRTFRGIELIWASPRELLNVVQADQIGCDIITVTSDILKKLDLMGRDLADYSLDTVKMFYNDACSSGYSL